MSSTDDLRKEAANHFTYKYSRELQSQLVFEEGIKLDSYPDPKHKEILTIGVGHNLIAKPLDVYGEPIPFELTLDAAVGILINDLDETVYNLGHSWGFFKTMPEGPRRDAIIAMAFQLGVTSFNKFVNFKMMAEHHAWESAKDAALNSAWAKQVPERAYRVVNQLASGEYYEV